MKLAILRYNYKKILGKFCYKMETTLSKLKKISEQISTYLPKYFHNRFPNETQEIKFVSCARLHGGICQSNVNPYQENYDQSTNGVFGIHNAHNTNV